MWDETIPPSGDIFIHQKLENLKMWTPWWNCPIYHILNHEWLLLYSVVCFTYRDCSVHCVVWLTNFYCMYHHGLIPVLYYVRNHTSYILLHIYMFYTFKFFLSISLARNKDNVSEWGDMSIHGLLFQWASVAFNYVL
jgi:hypothetical protein